MQPIKSNDLRIGNLVGKNEKEITINANNILAASNGVDYTAIPLTEEWLNKFNFQHFKENNSWQLDSNLGFSIWGRVGEGFDVFLGSDTIGNSFNHVHSLQNVWHSLSGTELTAKK